MFGLSLKDKTKKVLGVEFEYRPNSIQKPVLSMVVSQAKDAGANQYDAAIFFMLVQMNTLEPEEGSSEIRGFVLKHIANIERCMPNAATPHSEIGELLDSVADKHGIDRPSGEYDEWLVKFKVVCANINAQLAMDDEGKSIIDFMDQSPLRKAYYDGVLPGELAQQFAPTFDMETFGGSGDT